MQGSFKQTELLVLVLLTIYRMQLVNKQTSMQQKAFQLL